MPKLSKRILAETFKNDCERFFRFELSSEHEKKEISIDGNNYSLGNRPGVQLMQEAGNKWEIDKYDDLIRGFGSENIRFERKTEVNPRLGVKEFKEVTNLIDILKQETPPKVIIEGSFPIPQSVSSEIQEAYKLYGIEPSRAIPDIIWIRPYNTQSPLIQDEDELPPEYELHIIDVKMAAQASLKHFTEVTFYAIALDAFIRENKLNNKYRVSAKGLIWPGSHDAYEFKNRLRKHEAEGKISPAESALEETLIAVPYEIYEVHVKEFFKERMLPILATPPLQVAWHVSSKCQLCQYLSYCIKMASEVDHLSKIPWLNKTQAELLCDRGINKSLDLAIAIIQNIESWNAAKKINHQLRADELAILARAEALKDNEPKIVKERKSQLMPNWVDMSVFITVHFDPGSGITFALGAKRVYFKPLRTKGEPPLTNEQVFIVERVEQLNPDTERNRLIEFIDLVSSWYLEVDSDNESIRAQKRNSGERDSAFGKMTAHAFFWSQLEATQFMRMIKRHMNHPDVVDRIELLMRLFPPDDILPPDLEIYKSQPGTIVKRVIKQLVGLPIPHDYTLIETANKFYPFLKEDGSLFQFYHSFGFSTPLNDQIPFERAYELWKDDVFLRHSEAKGKRKYTRDEIHEGIRRSVKIHLSALQQVVMRLREYCGNQLVLKKPPFSASKPSQMRIPQKSRNLVVFNKLNAISQEIENMHDTSLPIEEKESRFISIRGLVNKTDNYQVQIQEIRDTNNSLISSNIMAFEFSENSRDSKFKEGDFLCCLSNEELGVSIYSKWYPILGVNYYMAQELLDNAGVQLANYWINKNLSSIFRVNILKLESTAEIPYLIVEISNFSSQIFQFGIEYGLLDLSKPMVLDPVFEDYETADVENVLRLIGGRAPSRTRRQ